MGDTMLRQAAEKFTVRRRRRRWNRVVRVMAAVVVFCTVYALVLPAITMGDDPICGMEPHTHADGCWRTASVTSVCPADGETVLHSHDEGCYDEFGTLWCPLPERTAHLHTDGCMEEREVLVCLLDEREPHTHEDSCMGEENVLSCGQEESQSHTHTDACYAEETVLTCAETHDHTDACYTVQERLICEIPENQGHVHSEDCYTTVPSVICGLEETLGHSHGAQCYEMQSHVVCGLEQVEEHSHGEGCYDENGEIICGITAVETHIHDENCCLVTPLAEKELVCTLVEHEHTESCFPSQEEPAPTESPYLCAMGEHMHGDGCYDENGEALCTLTEHVHTAQCLVKDYDGSADVETAEDWEASIAGVNLTGNLPKDILAIAQSQLGYRESSRNVWLCEDGSLKGYTRYGGWYGVPYGDWCAMFVSFCVHYAGGGDVPMDSVCDYYINKLADAGMYRDAADYIPKPGDLVFFDWERTGGEVTDVDHTGVVAEIIRDESGNPIKISTIEGNWEDCVQQRTYDYQNPVIIGYGEMPMGDGRVLVCEAEDHSHEDGCYGFRLFFRSEEMEGSLVLTGVKEIPEDLSLSVLPVTQEQDPMTYGAMNAAVELEMEQSSYFTGDMSLYQVWLLSGGEEYVLPEGAKAVVDLTFNAPVFDAADVAQGSGMLAFLLSPGEPITLFSGETVDTFEAQETLSGSYLGAENGLTGLRLELGSQRSFAVVLSNPTVTGTFWTRVSDKSELTAGETYMIVSAEGHFALRGSSSKNYMSVIVETVKDNVGYYTIKPRSSSDTINNTLYWTITPSGNNFVVQNQNTSNYLLGSKNSWYDSLQLIASYSKAATFAYQTTEKCWRISRNSTYLHNSGSGSFNTSTKADSTYNGTNQYYGRDMMIFKLSKKTQLEVRDDVEKKTDTGSGSTVGPPKPNYEPFIQPSGKKDGGTGLSGDGVTIEGKYFSDPSTSNIERHFDMDNYEENLKNDGMIRTDKSVIYGHDDYGAFSSYDANTFGVTLSVLGQEYEMPYAYNARTPVDVVFVLDVSGSMSSTGEGSSTERAEDMVEATNIAIKQIMDDHEANRVGVVLYATGAWKLLPLGRYKADNDQYLFTNPLSTTQNGFSKTIYYVQTSASLTNEKGDVSYGNLGGNKFNQGWGTYTQAGIALGYETFEAVTDTTYSFSVGEGENTWEETINRQPVYILLSDGEPTHCSPIYMDPIGGPHYGDGKSSADNAKGAIGFYTVLTANYFKRMAGIHYQTPALFFTIGMGINDTEDEPYITTSNTSDTYKRAVLNPTAENLEALSNNYEDRKTDVDVQFQQLIYGKSTQSTTTTLSQWPDPWTGIPHIVTPMLNYNPYQGQYSYADGAYFNVMSKTDLEGIFNKIMETSLRETPYGFILHKSSSMEITDRIGEGMEIKGDPILRFQGKNYTVSSKVEDEVGIRYIYDQVVDHPDIPGRKFDLKEIVVHSYINENGHQVISMYIPDNVLPVYTPELEGKQFYYEMLPVRLIYQVGLTAQSEAAVLDLYTEGGSLTFYTNVWEEEGEQSIANLYPSLDNPFYYPTKTNNGIFRYHSHHDLKTENTTDTLEYIVDCSKRPDTVDGEAITKVFHKLGNNGKLVFTVPQVDIPVEKQWSGGVVPEEGTEVAVDLYRVQVTSTGKEEATLVKTITLSAENGWKGTFTDIAKLTEGYYAIAEHVSDKFQPQYSGETKTLVIDNRNVLVAVVDLSDAENIPTIVVTNILKVVLPATGGMGTTVYYALGMLLIAAALVYVVGFGTLRRREGS